MLIAGDVTSPQFCRDAIERTVRELGRLDILVSNAAHQDRKEGLEDITDEEWDRTFRTNIHAFFYLAKAALPHLKPGSAIIATSSETGLIGNKKLLDYSATKGAINAFTKALAQNLLPKGIRVNAVAPGPVWTPLNPADAGATPEKVAEFGKDSPIGLPPAGRDRAARRLPRVRCRFELYHGRSHRRNGRRDNGGLDGRSTSLNTGMGHEHFVDREAYARSRRRDRGLGGSRPGRRPGIRPGRLARPDRPRSRRARRARREVEEAGGRALVLPLDVADAEAVDRGRRRVEHELGPIDVWVNDAMVSVFSPVARR